MIHFKYFKHCLLLFLLIIAVIALGGCSFSRRVPDKRVRTYIDAHLQKVFYFLDTIPEYEAVISHKPDPQTYSDITHINLTICDEHLTAVTAAEFRYAYNTASKAWTKSVITDWNKTRITRYRISNDCRVWQKTMNRVFDSEVFPDISIEELTTEQLSKALGRNDVLSGWYGINTSGMPSYNISSFTVSTPEGATEALEDYFEGLTSSSSVMGKDKTLISSGINYEIYSITSREKYLVGFADSCGFLFRIDDTVFLLQAYNYASQEMESILPLAEKLSEVMRELGVILLAS